MRNYDLQFLKRFSIVIAILAVVTVGLIIFASFLQRAIPTEASPQAVARVEQRIAPAGRARSHRTRICAASSRHGFRA